MKVESNMADALAAKNSEIEALVSSVDALKKQAALLKGNLASLQLQKAAKLLDSGAIRATRFLWQYPTARLLLLFYLPEASEMKKIVAEGILTCLQDAIDLLNEKQDIQQMTEQWNFIPRVVEELAKLESTTNGSASLSKEELCSEAMTCEKIYEVEYRKLKKFKN